jgi:hypothetical protein
VAKTGNFDFSRLKMLFGFRNRRDKAPVQYSRDSSLYSAPRLGPLPARPGETAHLPSPRPGQLPRPHSDQPLPRLEEQKWYVIVSRARKNAVLRGLVSQASQHTSEARRGPDWLDFQASCCRTRKPCEKAIITGMAIRRHDTLVEGKSSSPKS